MMRAALGVLTVTIALVVSGCAGDGAGRDLMRQIKPIDLGPGDTTLVLPQPQSFGITDVSVQRTAGGGTADADAHAVPAGQADAKAGAGEGGTALAWFQLGHAFDNNTDRQVQVTLSLNVAYEYEVTATPATGLPDAAVTLDLVLRNRRTRSKEEINLLAYTSELRNEKKQAQETRERAFLVAPGDTYDVFLVGTAKCDSKTGRSGAARLNVTAAGMTLRTAAAPAVLTTQPTTHGAP